MKEAAEDGAWFPFGEHRAEDSDGPLFMATPRSDRIPPRVLNLMIEEVAQFHLRLWPTCDYADASFDTSNERVEIVAFSEDAYHSAIDLGEWLRAGFADPNQTGDEPEIIALEKLKAVCEELIEVRRKRIASRPDASADLAPLPPALEPPALDDGTPHR